MMSWLVWLCLLSVCHNASFLFHELRFFSLPKVVVAFHHPVLRKYLHPRAARPTTTSPSPQRWDCFDVHQRSDATSASHHKSKYRNAPYGNMNNRTSNDSSNNDENDESRRRLLITGAIIASSTFGAPKRSSALDAPTTSSATTPDNLTRVIDPQSYSALVYKPPSTNDNNQKLPLLIVLHGAGKNQLDAWDLANPKGEHAGLAPSLLATHTAPIELSQNFIVIAPYSKDKRSFYEEPRSKLLNFISWVMSPEGRANGCPDNIDPNRIFLFGFSDGATLGVELMTTRRFRGGVFASYGFTGVLPEKAKERLKGLPIWVFHSKDDVIFPVKCSDELVKALRTVNNVGAPQTNADEIVRYTRYDVDQEGFVGTDVQGHSTGITASKQSEVYKWLLEIKE